MPAPGARVWPNAPAEEGKYYGITDKYGAKLIVMTQAMWEQLGTIIESSRTTMRAQDDAIKRQSNHIREITADRDDLMRKLTNLRSSHRELLAERAAKDMNLPRDHASDYTAGIFSPTKGPK